VFLPVDFSIHVGRQAPGAGNYATVKKLKNSDGEFLVAFGAGKINRYTLYFHRTPACKLSELLSDG